MHGLHIPQGALNAVGYLLHYVVYQADQAEETFINIVQVAGDLNWAADVLVLRDQRMPDPLYMIDQLVDLTQQTIDLLPNTVAGLQRMEAMRLQEVERRQLEEQMRQVQQYGAPLDDDETEDDQDDEDGNRPVARLAGVVRQRDE
jgi:hypothetical protein